MPGEALAEFIIRPILELLLQLIGYITARILFPVISFGFISVSPSPKGLKVYPKWHGINKSSDGKIILHEEMGALLGIVFWILIICVGIFTYSNFMT